ncbi:uncharacterized protein [Procambarus clarkii]|uniref:uncharacterized protein isoform X2 n=1 Tax=Procambarus clarkii TaxID=6728 RepID=UPI0037432B37
MEGWSTMKVVVLLVVCCALLAPPAAARPPYRQKRVSDQRLAELETLLALAKMKNRKYVTLPVGFGLIDVKQIGRRKRATSAAIGTPRMMAQSLDEYDLSDLITELSSSLGAEALRNDRSLEESNYQAEDANLEEEELKEDRKEGLLQQGLREAPPTILFGMRGVPRHRFI